MRTKLFCALDFDDAETARAMYRKLKPIHDHYKIGLELFASAGPDFVRELVDDGARVFLDLKFHDIPNTVAGAVRQVARLGVGWINVHLAGGREMVQAACGALEQASPKSGPKPALLGVTVLTSVNDAILRETNVSVGAGDQVLTLAKLGHDWGVDGIVCSALELARVRKALPRDFITVVPGIRPAGTDASDQARVATPECASRDGADYLVIGRPICAAPDPVAALKSILSSL